MICILLRGSDQTIRLSARGVKLRSRALEIPRDTEFRVRPTSAPPTQRELAALRCRRKETVKNEDRSHRLHAPTVPCGSSVVKTETCACPNGPRPKYFFDFDDESPCLREALQAELTSTPNNIEKLQNAFYSSKTAQRIFIYTNMNVSVNITCEPREECNSTVVVRPYSWRHIWYEDNFIGLISELTTGASTTGPIIGVTNPVVTLLRWVQTFASLLVPGSDYNTVSTLQLKIELNCVSRHKPNFDEVEAEAIRKIWEGILQWVSIL